MPSLRDEDFGPRTRRGGRWRVCGASRRGRARRRGRNGTTGTGLPVAEGGGNVAGSGHTHGRSKAGQRTNPTRGGTPACSGESRGRLRCPGAFGRSVDEAKGMEGAPLFYRTARRRLTPGPLRTRLATAKGREGARRSTRQVAPVSDGQAKDRGPPRHPPTTLEAHANVVRATGRGTDRVDTNDILIGADQARTRANHECSVNL